LPGSDFAVALYILHELVIFSCLSFVGDVLHVVMGGRKTTELYVALFYMCLRHILSFAFFVHYQCTFDVCSGISKTLQLSN